MLLALSANNFCKHFGSRSDGMIWVQTVRQSDVLKRFFLKKLILKIKSADNKKKHQTFPTRQSLKGIIEIDFLVSQQNYLLLVPIRIETVQLFFWAQKYFV